MGCTTCGSTKCSGCGRELKEGQYIHVFAGEDVCDECNGTSEQLREQLAEARDLLARAKPYIEAGASEHARQGALRDARAADAFLTEYRAALAKAGG